MRFHTVIVGCGWNESSNYILWHTSLYSPGSFYFNDFNENFKIIQKLPYNRAADYWSFGILIYELITGEVLFSFINTIV